jgi:ABC-2 type transport system permease protein
MKILSIARKSLLELWREPLLLALMLFFSVVLVYFYYIAFGHTEEGLATFLVVQVVNEDKGATLADGSARQAGAELIKAIRAEKFDGQPVFNLSEVAAPGAAEIALRERKISLLLKIPPDFSQALAGELSSPASIGLVGDPNSDSFIFARSMLEGVIRGFVAESQEGARAPEIATYEFLPGTGTMSDFDFGVAGIIVFGICFALITTATVLVRENVGGTLRRLRLTTASARDLLVGVALAQMAVIVAQIFITFGAAIALGFQNNGSLLLMVGIGLLFSLSVIGLGLMVACFARNDGEAANLASGLLVPLVFLSGALFPMPDAPLFKTGSITVQAYDFSPATHATEALRRVMIFGDGLPAIGYELVMLSVLSAVILAGGIVMYQRLQLKKV